MTVPTRTTADDTEDAVVFLIGMRIGSWWRLRQWLPVFLAMPRMLSELHSSQLGLLDARTYVSGRVLLVVQYWSSSEALHAYARATDSEHLPAWRAFSRRAATSPTVGIYHETYLAPRQSRESVYVSMPAHGLAAAVGSTPMAGSGAARRRRAAAGSEPALTPAV